MLLHPDYAWQKPRKIVGASSWSTACRFLLDPVRLGAELQRFNPLQMSAVTAEVLEAYVTHAKWPRNYSDVRPVFYGLLTFMMHVQHVHEMLALRSGSLQSSSTRRHNVERKMADEHEFLAKNTNIIDYSR